MNIQANTKEPAKEPDGKRDGQKKGDPCEFIDPPNLLLAKVTNDPTLKEVRNLTESNFKLDKTRLRKMKTLITENQERCISALNKKIQQIEQVYRDLQQGTLPQQQEFIDQCNDIHAAAKALDHIPVIRITASLLRYIQNHTAAQPMEPSIIIAHLDALFNRNALDQKLDAPTKLVLTALETLVDHTTVAKS